MRNLEVAGGVADRGVATARVPAQETAFFKRQTSERFNASREGDVLRKGRYDFGSSERVQDVTCLT